MKVPSAPIGVSAAIADNENLKKGVYEFLKFYYGEEAAKISYRCASGNISASRSS